MPLRPSDPFGRLGFLLTATLVTGVLLRFVVGLHPVWWLAWLAPVPLLLLAFRLNGLEARWTVFLAALVGASATFHYRQLIFSLPFAVSVTLGQALIWTLVVMQVRRLVLHYKAAWTVLAYNRQ